MQDCAVKTMGELPRPEKDADYISTLPLELDELVPKLAFCDRNMTTASRTLAGQEFVTEDGTVWRTRRLDKTDSLSSPERQGANQLE